MSSAVVGAANAAAARVAPHSIYRHAPALAATFSLLVASLTGRAASQPINSGQPTGSYIQTAGTLVAGNANLGRLYESRGDFEDALSTYALAARNAADIVNTRPLSLQDRLSFELIVSTASLDATRVVVQMSGGRDVRALRFLAAAEQWQEAAMRDAGDVPLTQEGGPKLISLAYTAQGYLDVMEGKREAAVAHLDRAGPTQPARNLMAALGSQRMPRMDGINARKLYAMWQNRPRLDPQQAKELKAVVGIVSVALMALKLPAAAIAGIVVDGIDLFERP